MCYELQLSTDAPFDLSTLNQEAIFFEKCQQINQELKYPHTYRLATFAPVVVVIFGCLKKI